MPMVNLMIGESAGFFVLVLMKPKYRSKINVEKEIPSLIPRFEQCAVINRLSHPTNNCKCYFLSPLIFIYFNTLTHLNSYIVSDIAVFLI